MRISPLVTICVLGTMYITSLCALPPSGMVGSLLSPASTAELAVSPAGDPTTTLASHQPYPGIWISPSELARLPTSGQAWEQLKAAADQEAGRPDLSDQDDPTNVLVLAKALVYARTGEQQYRNDVVGALRIITFENTEQGGRTLSLGRELAAYVISADLINLAGYDPDLDLHFREKLRGLLTEELSGRTLQSTNEDRPNNWGTHAGASRAAVALYLGDATELERTAQVFKGWLGDRDTYADFVYKELWWQCDPAEPVGINPVGCTKQGHSIDGAQPEEMRRGGRFQWPPAETGYPWEALQGALVQAEILQRAGYPAWEWEDQGLLRAVHFLHSIGWEAEGDDQWQMWLINHALGTSFPAVTPARTGKNMGWTDWTHSGDSQLSDTETITESIAVTTGPSDWPTDAEPFEMVTIEPDFEVNGEGRNVDSIAFWQAPDPDHTLMFVTAKNNQLVEVWQYPFVDNELPPLRHASFGSGTRVNGVAVDQENNRLYVSVSEPASTVSIFSLPELGFIGGFVEGDVNLKSEPNITVLKHSDDQTRVYVSADNIVYVYDGDTGTQIGDFRPAKGLEMLVADDFYQVIYIPDENDKTGIYAYDPEGTPFERGGTNGFGGGGIFRSDAEGIVLYTCPADGSRDNGSGLLIVAEQKSSQTDFEFFDRQTWEHLGTVRLEGVSNTDGIATIQKPLPDYPSGLFVAVNDDTSVVGVGWDKIFGATGLGCGTKYPP